ncbi:uncharacterized protein N7515_003770 [Penicillium bovifimosum]|uniref:Uncharacterized protein n=1 Tax=Penicillium bovifimosum TaxID=126998 RepID=A0A9W9H5A3_9EURO|nr:uncharacterized protein N7515_003770 [Penicillium bovifimosum]KAJ5138922.1 hypothetical protein N7515_003770 [Penicillium bovifimosum]
MSWEDIVVHGNYHHPLHTLQSHTIQCQNTSPLTPPATPLALQPHHLLSPPPDRLTDTATTLTITNVQESDDPPNTTCTSIINHIHTHEPPDSPNRQTPLFTVNSKQWPNTTRIICAVDGTPLLVLRRIWLSSVRKWVLRLPEATETQTETQTPRKKEKTKPDLLAASIPWSSEGHGKIGLGHGHKLDVKFINAFRPEGSSSLSRSISVSNLRSRPDDPQPPPYTASVDTPVSQEAVPRGKQTPIPFSNSNTTDTSVQARPRPTPTIPTPIYDPIPPSATPISPSPAMLPTYDSVRRNTVPLNTFRDLLDAIEPPQEPAALIQLPTNSSADGDDAGSGLNIELKVMQHAAVGMGVMMGNDMIVRITKGCSVDYSRSKPRTRVRWEVEVAEGVDLLLAVGIVLIIAEAFSNRK